MAADDRLTPVLRGLVASACAAAGSAYAPYSGFRVGAAALGSSGRVYLGSNIENASYPVTLCAERAAVAAALTAGERHVLAVAVAAGDQTVDTVTPCGMCRQFLAEFGETLTVVSRQGGVWIVQPVGELLPATFSLPGHCPSGGPPASTDAVPGGGTARLQLRRVDRAGLAELQDLARREQEVFGHTGLRVEDLRVVSRAGAVYDGLVDGSLVGSCQLLRVFDDPAAAWVVGFYVLPAFRGRGLGRELLAAVASEAAAAGVRRLVLTVGPDNLPALNLYQSFGCETIETIRDFYGPGEDRLLLSCPLEPKGEQRSRAPGRPPGGDGDHV